MSDRTSAGIFGRVFELLAKHPDKRSKEFALQIWEDARHYDFDWRQMCCDDALMKLGLAKLGTDPSYPRDGEVTLYRANGGWSS